MPELNTFSQLLEQETQEWIDDEIRKGNKVWKARRATDGFSTIHWDMVIKSAAQIKKHLADDGQNMTQGIFLCRCIQRHCPELLKKSDGTTVKTSDLVNCKPEDLKPWTTADIKLVAENLKTLCLQEIGCENPGTAWDSILKRDAAYRRAGDRQEAYHIAFLLKMTAEEMQRYFFLTRQEGFSLRDPLDIVCFTFKFFDKGKEDADSFCWRDVTDLLQEYLDACKEADAEAESDAAPDTQSSAPKEGSTIHLDSDIKALHDNMHSAKDDKIDIPDLKKKLKEYLVTHRRSLVDVELNKVHPQKLSPAQSRIEISTGYPYSYTVQTELSVLVGYLLVLYGCWNDVVQVVYPKNLELQGELMLSDEEGAAPKLLSADDFLEVLSSKVIGKIGSDVLEPLKEAFLDKLDPDSLEAAQTDKLSPQDTALLMGRWLLRITPQRKSADDFEKAIRFLNDFLSCVNEIDDSFSPASDYPASARNASAAIWHLAGRLHCKKSLEALVAPGPKAATPSASDWAKYLSTLGLALCKAANDSNNFNDRERCGILNSAQHSSLRAVFTSLPTYDLCRDSSSESNNEASRYKYIQEHLEMGLPNISSKIGYTLGKYYPKAKEGALRNIQVGPKKLDGWYWNNKLGSNLLSREDVLQLFFFLILAVYDCYKEDDGKEPEEFTPEHSWLNAMRDKAEEELKGEAGTTGSFLQDTIFTEFNTELMCLLDEPKTDTVSKDWSDTICKLYNFLLDGLSHASGTTWHHIYYPAYTDRFYVLAGALATAVPQSRRTLGFMMGAQRDKYKKMRKSPRKTEEGA